MEPLILTVLSLADFLAAAFVSDRTAKVCFCIGGIAFQISAYTKLLGH